MHFLIGNRDFNFIEPVEVKICTDTGVTHKPSVPVSFHARKPNHDIFGRNRCIFCFKNCICRRNNNRLLLSIKRNSDALISSRLHTRKCKLSVLNKFVFFKINFGYVRNRRHKLFCYIYALYICDRPVVIPIIDFYQQFANCFFSGGMLNFINQCITGELQILQAALVCLLIGDHCIIDIDIFLLCR